MQISLVGAALGLWLLAVGLCVGSFLNVVIHRLPLMLHRQWRREAEAQLEDRPAPFESAHAADAQFERFNLMRPRSHCPACRRPIKAVENIPLVSWVWLRGKCAGCAASISFRYPLVEALGAVAALWAVTAFGFTWLALAAAVYAWALIALAGTDVETGLLPD